MRTPWNIVAAPGRRNDPMFIGRHMTPENIPGLMRTKLTPTDGRNKTRIGKQPEEHRTDDESNTSEREAADDTLDASDDSHADLALLRNTKDKDTATTLAPTQEEEETTPEADMANTEKEDETHGRKRSSTPTQEGPSTKRLTPNDSPPSDKLVIDEDARPSEGETDKDKDSDISEITQTSLNEENTTPTPID